jgi:hypothetical protein
MNERIHAYLDGDLPLDELSPEERASALRMERSLGLAASHVRTGHAPELVGRVMAALPQPAPAAAPRPSSARRAWAWLWTPRRIAFDLRPGAALAGAMVFALAAVMLPVRGPGVPTLPIAVADAPQPPPVYVQFRLVAAGARQVELAGTFTGWKPRVEMQQTSPGVWTALVPLRPGVHDYAFVVDGDRWVADPNAPHVDDSFGGTNSRISLPPPGNAA